MTNPKKSRMSNEMIARHIAEWAVDKDLWPIQERLGLMIKEALDSIQQETIEACAKVAECDSVLSWIGGSTGNAKMTADNIAQAIRQLSKKER